MPLGFTYPTSLWIEDEIIAETLILDLNEVPAGDYQIAIGWYHPEQGRLFATESGTHLQEDRFILSEIITIPLIFTNLQQQRALMQLCSEKL